MQLEEYDDFLSADQCEYLINQHKNTPIQITGSTWDRQVRRVEFGDMDISQIEKIGMRQTGEKLALDNPHVVKWEKGDSMRPHSDYGAKNEFPWRKYASIVYLNNEYIGGEVFFPQLNLEIKPRKGTLVIFNGGELFHGVKEVLEGERFTFASWLAPC